jgi:hypothetical protein
MLAPPASTLRNWWSSPTGLVFEPAPVPDALRFLLTAMAAGVVVPGVRDLYAALGLPGGAWPWQAGAGKP